MLNFLRKHQKIFFIFITGAIIISFTFFGTYNTMSQKGEVPDKPVVKGVCGKTIMQQELSALCRLIESSALDRAGMEKRGIPNLLNDGVIERDFLASGMGVLLAKNYFASLQPDFEARLKKIHTYRPYVHPRAPQISAEGVWARFAPHVLEHYRQMKGKTASLESFALFAQLYLDQVSLPSDSVKQILFMQQNQQNVQPDPLLAGADLSLYGFKSFEDWFGPRFVSLIGQFILNAAQIAEDRGYEVKTAEARAELFQNIFRGYQQFSPNSPLKAEEAEQYYQSKMHALGMDETLLISSWKKVMLFRKLFDDASGSVLVDPLAYRQFAQFANDNVSVNLYELPHAMQFGDFRTMLKFQLYLEGVSPDAARLRTDLNLPKQLASLEQIEKRAPEFVERKMEIEYCSVSKEDLARGISVKETWDWEAKDANWDALKKQFPQLQSNKPASLDTVDEKLRLKIDQFARKKMVEAHPEKVRLALDAASPKTISAGLRLKGGNLPFSGVKEESELNALLENAALKGQTPNTANDRLQCYSADGEHYYRIYVLERESAKKILAFDEALSDGTLDKLLDKRLEEAYPDARRKDARPFQMPNGTWKPVKEVRDQVGKLAFADLLKAIEEHYRSHYGMLPGNPGDLPLNFYSNARLLPYMADAQKALKANPEEASVLKGSRTDLAAQWLLEKTEKVLERSSEVLFSKEEMFTLSPQQWSSVKAGERGAVAFYYVKEKGKDVKPPVDIMEKGHQILAFDAKRDIMQQILTTIDQKKAIDLTVAEERP